MLHHSPDTPAATPGDVLGSIAWQANSTDSPARAFQLRSPDSPDSPTDLVQVEAEKVVEFISKLFKSCKLNLLNSPGFMLGFLVGD